MTEYEWQTGVRTDWMLNCLEGQTTDRKLRLFAVACCRRVWPIFKDELSRQAVDLAEGFADGLVTIDELQRFQNVLIKAHRSVQWRRTEGQREVNAAARESASCKPLTIADARCVSWWCARAADRKSKSSASRLRAAKDEATDDETKAQCDLLRDLFGDPFHPKASVLSWNTPAVTKAAKAIYEYDGFDRLPRFAETLEGAGCADSEILDHCRSPAKHIRGCWVLDLILRKK